VVPSTGVVSAAVWGEVVNTLLLGYQTSASSVQSVTYNVFAYGRFPIVRELVLAERPPEMTANGALDYSFMPPQLNLFTLNLVKKLSLNPIFRWN